MASVATTTIVAKGWRQARYVQGDLATAARPGLAFARTAINNVFTLGTSTHGVHKLYWVEFKHRTSTTFGEMNISANISTTEEARL